MEQHPIPQNISSYQFRLVGDMTLKQFFELAGGILVALIFYSAPLPGIIKWPFIIVSALLGAAMAFVPVEERPLEQWILAFFRTIYSPTIFNWKKTTTPIKYFADEVATPTTTPTQQDMALNSYMNSAKNTGGLFSKFEGAEQGFLASLSGMFSGLRSTVIQKPVSQPIVRAQTPVAPTTTTPIVQQPKKIEIPVSNPIKVTPAPVQPQTPHLVVEERTIPQSQSIQIQTQQVNPTIVGEEIISTKEAIFSVDAAPPSPPTNPNVVVGQVVDDARKIIEGAIIEIRDEYGRPIRALRSNKLGHFIAVTSLDNGHYSIISEKDGYEFMPVNFEARGQVIPPILVVGKNILAQPAVSAPVSAPIQTVAN